MTTTDRKTPALQLPKPEIADRGAVRLGAIITTADFPSLKPGKPEIAARGAVRLGAIITTGDFPHSR
jgi:hypothetical protein